MLIKQVDRKHNEFNEYEFHSFEEVFDYVLEQLSEKPPSIDSLMFGFKILDSNEVFTIMGKADGEDSYVCGEIDFVEKCEVNQK